MRNGIGVNMNKGIVMLSLFSAGVEQGESGCGGVGKRVSGGADGPLQRPGGSLGLSERMTGIPDFREGGSVKWSW